MRTSKLMILVLSSSIPLPILYLIGLGNHLGQLTAYGVPGDLYPMTIEQTLTLAFVYLYANWMYWLFLLPGLFFIYAISLFGINYIRPKFHSKPGPMLLKFWATEEWFKKYLDEDISKLLLVAKVLFLAAYFGLIVFVVTLVAYLDGKDQGKANLAITKCMLTDEKGNYTSKGGSRLKVKSEAKAQQVYVLQYSDKFITYYSATARIGQLIITKPMSEIVEWTRQGDIFAKDWGEESEKSINCKKKVANDSS